MKDSEIIKAVKDYASSIVSNTKLNMQGKAGKVSTEQKRALGLLRLILGREPAPQEISAIVGVE